MSPLRRLWDYSGEWRSRYVSASVYTILNKLFDIAPEILIGVAVDVAVQREGSFLASLGLVDLRMQIFTLGVLTVLIWGGESFFQYLYQVAWRTLAQAMQHKVRREAYDHVQHLRMEALGQRRHGELQTLLTEDVNQLERFLNTGLAAILHVLTSTIAVSIFFFAIAPKVAAFAILPVPIIIIVALWFQRGLASRYAAVRASAGRLGARLTSQLQGIATLKAYTAQDRALDALTGDSEAYEATNKHAIRLSSAFVPLIRMAVLSGFVVTLVYGGLRTLEGTLAVGAYSVLVFLTQRLLWPFTRLGETIDLYQRSMASTTRLLDLFTLEREQTDTGDPISADTLRGDIAFEAVHFAYPERDTTLDGISLTVPGEAFAGLAGSTGSGKSTLVKLLLRFYAPQSGRITVGGVDLSTVRLDDLRRQIAWVSQEVFLFHGSVHENISLGRPEATRAEVIAAARAAELHDFIESLPEGYDSPVGDFGLTLSGGQRQRLSIARAILQDPSILILDEATSAVDNDTEAAIQRSLARIAQGRTVIAVAHRLSTVRQADPIFVLEDGRIVEQGTHDALNAQGGRYARLWSMQIGEAPS